jgi:hypothetical protein
MFDIGWLSAVFISKDNAAHRAVISARNCGYAGAILRHTFLKEAAKAYIIHKSLTVFIRRDEQDAFEEAITEDPTMFALSSPVTVGWTSANNVGMCMLDLNELTRVSKDIADPTEESDSTYIRYMFWVTAGGTACGHKFYEITKANGAKSYTYLLRATDDKWDVLERSLKNYFFSEDELTDLNDLSTNPALVGTHFVMDKFLKAAEKYDSGETRDWVDENRANLLGGLLNEMYLRLKKTGEALGVNTLEDYEKLLDAVKAGKVLSSHDEESSS